MKGGRGVNSGKVQSHRQGDHGLGQDGDEGNSVKHYVYVDAGKGTKAARVLGSGVQHQHHGER